MQYITLHQHLWKLLPQAMSGWRWCKPEMKKKRADEKQTLRAGCSKAEPKNFASRRPLLGGAGRPKLNQLEMVTTFTYKPSLVRIDACNFELSW